jgi:hypothetical protein
VVAIARALNTKYAPLLREVYPPAYVPTPADVLGCWAYHAEGTTCLREFRADGTIQSYKTDGTKLDWFKGLRWRIQGSQIIATREGGPVIALTLTDAKTLVFRSEGFGAGWRVPVPGQCESRAGQR